MYLILGLRYLKMLSIHFHKVRFLEDVSSRAPGNESTWNHVITAEYLSYNFSCESIFKIVLLSHQVWCYLLLLVALAFGFKRVDVCLSHTVTITSTRSRNLAAGTNIINASKPNYPGTSPRHALIPLHGAMPHGYPSLPCTATPHDTTVGCPYAERNSSLHFKMSPWLQREAWTHCTTVAALPCKSCMGNEKMHPNILLRKKSHWVFFSSIL